MAPLPVGWKYLASSMGSLLLVMLLLPVTVRGRLRGVTPPVERAPDGILGVDCPTGWGSSPGRGPGLLYETC